MNPAPFPWQQEAWSALAGRLDRLAHALLLAGPEGLGKNAFTERLAQLLLCMAPVAGTACGRCQSCQLLAAGSHPDLHVVQPEGVYKNTDSLLARYAVRYPPENKSRDSKESTAIRIDQVRALIDVSHRRPLIAGRKILILSPADALNLNAANSLLKLLEEPSPDSHLLLVSAQPTRLPATVRSRCAPVPFRPPARDQGLAWLTSQALAPAQAQVLLDLAGGAPLRALALAQGDFLDRREQLLQDLEALAAGRAEPTACGARWKALGAGLALGWWQTCLADLIRLAFGAGAEETSNRDLAARLHALGKGLNLKQLFDSLEAVSAGRNLLGGPLDELLLLEDLLIRWFQMWHNPRVTLHG